MTSTISAEDIEKLSQPPDLSCSQEKSTLLSKYHLTVNQLEYDYIEKCQNGRELEKILHILKSGEEGHFPHLIETATKKLKEIKPNSKLLREATVVLKKNDIDNEEWTFISEDLSEWMKDVDKKDKELEERKPNKPENAYNSEYSIRTTKNELKSEEPKENAKRIASTDYKSWDKYDPDTEILKMDIEEEKLKKTALEDEKMIKTEKTKTVKYNNFVTAAEATYEANLEKDRGNECYKAKEYTDAVNHYTNSLNIKTCPVTYANRALAYNKLKKYKLAIEDCKTAIKYEPKHLKARFRLAQNLDILGKHEEALENVEIAVEIEPNNKAVQELANKLFKIVGKSSINKRLQIEDITDIKEKKKPIKSILKNKNENKKFTIIPIPGTSKMPPPHFKKIYTDDPKIIKQETYNLMYKFYPIRYMPTIYEASDDEDEDLNNFPIVSPDDLFKKLNSIIKINDDVCEKTAIKKNFKNHKHACTGGVEIKKSIKIQESNSSIESNFEGGGGEPCNTNQEVLAVPEHLSPITFEQAIRQNNCAILAEILRRLDYERLDTVIGYALDDSSLTKIITCLYQYFMIPSEIHKVHSVLVNLIKVPRFEIIIMFVSAKCKMYINQLIQFLDQHDHGLQISVKNKYIL